VGIYDRPYMRRGPGGGWQGSGGVGFRLPPLTPMVRRLLLINAGAFLLQVFVDHSSAGPGPISRWFGVTVGQFWQVWRYLSFQFLHGSIGHILLNMLAVYFLGTALERHWGSKRFLRFYLSCGAAAGVSYVLIAAATDVGAPLIGASGGVYGLILAAAVLLPHFVVFFFFFPVPIRIAALIVFAIMVVRVLQVLRFGARLSPAAFADGMSQAAHFGGAAAGAVWIWVVPRLRGATARGRVAVRRGAWQRRIQRRAEQDAEVDRILRKIREEGIGSLSRAEKRTLQDATRRQQEEERDVRRL
jgi:membrane associated rhomboid family serine protease